MTPNYDHAYGMLRQPISSSVRETMVNNPSRFVMEIKEAFYNFLKCYLDKVETLLTYDEADGRAILD